MNKIEIFIIIIISVIISIFSIYLFLDFQYRKSVLLHNNKKKQNKNQLNLFYGKIILKLENIIMIFIKKQLT